MDIQFIDDEEEKLTGLKRTGLDEFYTKPKVAKLCIEQVETFYDLNNFQIIEPAAGNGSFSDILFQDYKRVYAYDVLPRGENIINKDFLTVSWNTSLPTMLIGNPPFGRQSSLVKKFIKHISSQNADVIAFILPCSFKKESMKKSFPRVYHLMFEMDLPKNSFIINEKDHDVPCVFQIWEKKDCEREEKIDETPNGFIYVKKEENPDFSIRRVGVYAGLISEDIDKSIQSHYFIKINLDNKKRFLEEFSKTVFQSNNTVGPKSISKGELTPEINRVILEITRVNPS
jgi:hypothetical protein